jgi:predicted nucleic acid-binding protein
MNTPPVLGYEQQGFGGHGGGRGWTTRVRKRDEERAVALLRSHEDKSYSLCDALSLVVMERLRVTEFDRHFRAYGRFTIL